MISDAVDVRGETGGDAMRRELNDTRGDGLLLRWRYEDRIACTSSEPPSSFGSCLLLCHLSKDK